MDSSSENVFSASEVPSTMSSETSASSGSWSTSWRNFKTVLRKDLDYNPALLKQQGVELPPMNPPSYSNNDTATSSPKKSREKKFKPFSKPASVNRKSNSVINFTRRNLRDDIEQKEKSIKEKKYGSGNSFDSSRVSSQNSKSTAKSISHGFGESTHHNNLSTTYSSNSDEILNG